MARPVLPPLLLPCSALTLPPTTCPLVRSSPAPPVSAVLLHWLVSVTFVVAACRRLDFAFPLLFFCLTFWFHRYMACCTCFTAGLHHTPVLPVGSYIIGSLVLVRHVVGTPVLTCVACRQCRPALLPCLVPARRYTARTLPAARDHRALLLPREHRALPAGCLPVRFVAARYTCQRCATFTFATGCWFRPCRVPATLLAGAVLPVSAYHLGLGCCHRTPLAAFEPLPLLPLCRSWFCWLPRRMPYLPRLDYRFLHHLPTAVFLPFADITVPPPHLRQFNPAATCVRILPARFGSHPHPLQRRADRERQPPAPVCGFLEPPDPTLPLWFTADYRFYAG